MSNGLHQGLLFCIVAAFVTVTGAGLYAQNPFNFFFYGPDTIYVGDDCTAPFTFNGDSVVVTSNVNANVSFSYDYASSGFNYGDLMSAGTVATLYVPVWDDQGNTDTFSFEIYFADTIAPVFVDSSLPPDFPFYNDLGDVPPPANVQATDNCGPVTISFSQSELADTCAGGPFYRTWTATDSFGNVSVYKQTLVLNPDQTPPQFTEWPVSGASSCDALPEAFADWLSENMSEIAATDANGIMGYGNDAPTTIPVGCDTTYQITFWATDSCGNTSYAMALFTVMDTSAPVVLNMPSDTVVDCGNIPPALHLNAGLIVDDCDTALTETYTETSTQSPDTFSCAHYTYTVVREWTLTDHCGNSIAFQQVVSVQDTSPPVFVAGLTPDTTVHCHQVPVSQSPQATDMCGSPVSLSLQEQITLGSCSDNYDLVRTWTAKDVCSNSFATSQILHVIDTIGPVFQSFPADTTVYCKNVPEASPPVVTDMCDTDPFMSLIEISTQGTDPSACTYYNYTLTRQWTAVDNCNNFVTQSQVVTVADTSAPVVVCPSNIEVAADSSLCQVTMALPELLTAYDACTADFEHIVQEDTVPVTHPASQDPNVSPVHLQLSFSESQPAALAGNVVLQLILNHVDGEGPSEYFNVYGEDGSLIGQTLPTDSQCGTSTTTFTNISPAELSAWAQDDGKIVLSLESAGMGTDGVNDICPGGEVIGQLSYDRAVQKGAMSTEYAVDGQATQAWMAGTSATMDVGTHTVVYRVSDCSGNTATCQFQIDVTDDEEPQLTCPADTTVYVKTDACDVLFELPYPSAVSDNCGFNSSFSYLSDTSILIFQADPNAGLIPENLIFNITGVSPNATGDAMFNIYFQGNNDHDGAFFNVYIDNAFVGTTELGNDLTECQVPVGTTIILPADSINTWAGDGQLHILLVPESDASVYDNFITPCGSLMPGPDSSSWVVVDLSFDKSPVMYATADTSGYLAILKPVNLLFPIGNNLITYSVEDAAGNGTSCDWYVTVADTIAPVAVAHNTIVTVSPSGAGPSVIDAGVVDGGSYDNCEITDMSLSPSVFDCTQAGEMDTVILMVTDAAGNVGYDTALVQIQNEVPQPAFSQGVCGIDTLYLFANAPDGSAGNVYTYAWTGPDGFVSQEVNPIIAAPTPASTGTYNVTVTGVTGCTAVGSVQVSLNATPEAPELTASQASVCPGEQVVLSTQAFAGGTVVYQWYKGVPPGGVLIGTTTSNSIGIADLSPGDYTFYAVVAINGCTSVPSNLVSVSFVPAVNLSVVPDAVQVCAGGTIQFGVENPEPGVHYQWMGPMAFFADQASVTLNSVTPDQGGYYVVSASQGGCIYEPDSLLVTVLALPPTPEVAPVAPLCTYDTLVLALDNYVSGAVHWTGPGGQDTTMMTGQLSLPAALSTAGVWQVEVSDGVCTSLPAGVPVFVGQAPDVHILSPGIVCQGEVIDLSFESLPAAATQQWSGPDQFASTLPNPSFIGPGGEYIVQVTTSAGCTGSDTIDLDVVAPPVVTALSQSGSGCFDGSDIVLSATVFPPGTQYLYHWSGPNGFALCCDVAQPVIPAADTGDVGYYTLEVEDEYGCISDAVSVLVSGMPKPPAPFVQVVPAVVCEGDTATIKIENADAYPAGAVSVQWFTPHGLVQNGSFDLDLTGTDTMDEGFYRAMISVSGCVSDTSNMVFLAVKKRPGQPVASSNSPVCPGEIIHLQTPHVNGMQYEWKGPGNYSSTDQNPVIVSASPAHTGAYKVRLNYAGCLSAWSDPVMVSLHDLPEKPVIETNSPVCRSGGVLQLEVSEDTKLAGGQYTWIRLPDDTIGPTAYFDQIHLTDLSDYPVGYNYFVVGVTDGTCRNVSDTVTVWLDTIPANSALAGEDVSVCSGEPVSLQAVWPSLGTGRWHQVCGFNASVANPDTNVTAVTVAYPGVYCFEWSLSNGGCRDYSRDTVEVRVNKKEQALAGDFIDTCQTDAVFLRATAPQNGYGTWSQPFAQENAGVKIVEENNPQTLVSGLQQGGRYVFYWTLSDEGCGTDTDSVEVRVAGGAAYAGEDIHLCQPEACVLLDAGVPSGFDEGYWSAPGQDVFFDDKNVPDAQACNLMPGANLFVWTVNSGNCGAYSRDSVWIYFEEAPVAVNDSFVLDYGYAQTVDLAANDDVSSSGYQIEILTPPAHVQIVSYTADGKLKLLPASSFTGGDYLTYRLCRNGCDYCSEAKAVLEMAGFDDCSVPTIFTPNQDGINDYLVIPCLMSGQYPGARLSVYNVWGDEVYHADAYQNDWDGTYRGAPVQEGTYYYIFDKGDGTPFQKGFLEIKY